jgi:NAD(P)-dependent dehydrogenase (short-subunit alcohol dehydrogenase family)
MKMPEKGAVIVTGGGHGLGRGMVLRLGQAGYSVLAADIDAEAARSAAEEVSATGGRAQGITLDVTDRASCEAAVAAAGAEAGGLYGLVNNAGIGKAIPFTELTEEAWDRTFDVNSKGVFLMCKAAAGPLVERRHGAIVNISSIAGKEGYANWSAYVATKHAVIGLTRALARELGPEGVRVNAVCPGAIRTAIWGPEPQSTDDPERLFDELAARTALGRNQTVEDIADAVEFLLGDGSRSITGQSLLVDSGLILS